MFYAEHRVKEVYYRYKISSSDRIQNYSSFELVLCKLLCCEGVPPSYIKGEILQTGLCLKTRVFGNHLCPLGICKPEAGIRPGCTVT